MFFDWDEAKRLSNLEKHDLDFIRAVLIYHNPEKLTVTQNTETEERFLDLAMLDGRLTALVYTYRNDKVRVISLRKARHPRETRMYQASKGH